MLLTTRLRMALGLLMQRCGEVEPAVQFIRDETDLCELYFSTSPLLHFAVIGYPLPSSPFVKTTPAERLGLGKTDVNHYDNGDSCPFHSDLAEAVPLWGFQQRSRCPFDPLGCGCVFRKSPVSQEAYRQNEKSRFFSR
ncbi:unnamed protein product [Protopolystoma xenopodis]|uniref:Uncharacterized protein n=1 Tax=Protopolystoma xenopodis TaxID=117903 RepID=A0A3S5BP65_9PLAT|nr:unnamed protein product [Protopolystoma xenopodis]